MSSRPTVVVHPDKQAVADAGAARLVTALLDAQAEGRAPHVVLTGGSLGSDIIASILQVPAHTAVDWSAVSVWWGDERYLPAGDGDRNDTQNDAAGLDRIGLDPANVHRVAGPDTSDSAEASAQRYAADLRAADAGTFDVVLLGVGPDAHVASLFPGHPAQLSTGVAVAVHDSPKPPPDRVSLTFECLGRAERVWFLVAGADKAHAVAVSVAGAEPAQSSAGQVHGIRETIWLVAADAASELPA